ncbi:hypothetical protein BC829DRAFT_381057 [Chytridium lagenaria]|nr:hypothetical protein BC829DRAFT_381057 [Chytridium lagenaria]
MIVGAHTSTSLPRPSSFLTDGGMDDPPPPAVTRGTPNPTRLTLAPPRPSTDSSRSNTSAVSKYPPALYTYKPPSASSSSTPTSPVLAASSASVSSQRSGAGSAAATVVGKRRPTPHLAFQPPVGTEVRGGEVRGVGQKQLETDLSYTKTHIW